MTIYTKLKGTIQERRKQDDTSAALEKLAANQDYIAMMSDINLENDEEEIFESEAEENE